VECLCREGVCGTCETVILDGEAEHFDQYLSDAEKASQKSMMICVSRAKGKKLVLDL
jgi:ferredoxin